MSFQTRLAIVEDSATFVHGLRAILEEAGGFDIVAVADNKEEAIRLVRQHRPDIALVDICIKPRPGPVSSADSKHGISLIEHLRVHSPDTSIVTITFSRSNRWIRQAIQSGTMGFICKDWSPEEIIHILRVVAAGQLGLTRDQLDLLAPEDRGDPWALTAREMDVLRLLERGLSNRDIALQLEIASATVRKHVERIREKLGAKTRGEAVSSARQRGII